MVERSTVGAAGLSRDSPSNAIATTTTTPPARIQRRRFIFCMMSGRAISIRQESKHLACQKTISRRIENKALQRDFECGLAITVAVSGAIVFDFGQYADHESQL
jgi:hypothetical protein